MARRSGGSGRKGSGKKSLPKLGTGARFRAMAAVGRKRRGGGRKGR
jgi:hypothetical protein